MDKYEASKLLKLWTFKETFSTNEAPSLFLELFPYEEIVETGIPENLQQVSLEKYRDQEW